MKIAPVAPVIRICEQQIPVLYIQNKLGEYLYDLEASQGDRYFSFQ